MEILLSFLLPPKSSVTKPPEPDKPCPASEASLYESQSLGLLKFHASACVMLFSLWPDLHSGSNDRSRLLSEFTCLPSSSAFTLRFLSTMDYNLQVWAKLNPFPPQAAQGWSALSQQQRSNGSPWLSWSLLCDISLDGSMFLGNE